MTTLEMARTFLEPGLLDPDLATLLGIFAAANATEPVRKAEALLVLHQARHIVGDEAGARTCALYALALARAHGLPDVTAQAGAALLRLYAGDLALDAPLFPGFEESLATRLGVTLGDKTLSPVVPPPALAGPALP